MSTNVSSYLNISHSNKTQPTYENSSSRNQRHVKEKHPRNAIIVNFSEEEHLSVEDVKSEFGLFGSVRSVVMCTMDGCQAYITMQDEPHRSARETVSQLLKITNGIMFVKGKVWMICRPKKWKQLTEKDSYWKSCFSKKGKTVDELTNIFQNFVRQNTSISQASLFSPSLHSFSTLSLDKENPSLSSPAAESCDSSVTITPYTFQPAQQSTGFIQLPPPYHLLPDTPFFRKTRIVPPPPMSKERSVPLAQKITDHYIASAKRSDSLMMLPRDCHSLERSSNTSSTNLELKCRWWNPL